MNNNKVDISVVLDKSGSMQSVLKDTIGGFNNFLDTQIDKRARITLVEFSYSPHTVYRARRISEAPRLTTETYIPSGGTALLDAIGTTIDTTGSRLRAIPEEDRPNRVIFVIVTDGEENSSKIYTAARIHEMINHQRDVYNWNFVFLGANQDAIKVGQSYGFGYGQTMTYAANAAGTSSAFMSVSNLSNAVATSTSVAEAANTSFTAEDRNLQTKAGA